MISQREKGELARFYTVTDPRKHEKGYTVYKVTARIISRKTPEDIQEITVWKRYSDFRKLHQDLWQIHRHLFRHSELFPPFAKAKVFGRFDDSVIEERRQCSEDLLQFSANIPALYSSQHIEDFFKDGEVQDGSELIGPAEPFSDFLADSLSDCSAEVPRDIGGVDDLTVTSQSEYGGLSSESDLISLLVDEDSLPELDDGMASGSESPNHVAPPDAGPAPAAQLREALASRAAPEVLRSSRAALFPSALKKKTKDYLDRAGELIRLAAHKEAEGDVQAALTHYRGGVDLLLQGVQGEVSPSRREAVKRKTAEYLMRAELLTNQHAHLNDIMGQSSTQSAVLGSQCCRPSWSHQSQCDDLNNYRVLGVIDKVLLVMDKRTQETFILKGLRKSSECGRVRKTILPHSVPHMVRLRKFIVAEDSIFLLVEYAEGGKLWSHISKYLRSSSPDESFDIPFIQKSHTTAIHSAVAVETAPPAPGPELGSSGSVDSGPGGAGGGVSRLQPQGGSLLDAALRGRRGLGEGAGSQGPPRAEAGATPEAGGEGCTNSYLTLCNEYEQEKVEPVALGRGGGPREAKRSTGGVSNGASVVTATPRTKLLLSNDSLSSPVGQGVGFFAEEEEEERSEVFSADSLDRSKHSPMEFFRIDSKDSAGEVTTCHDLSTEVTEVTEVKGHVSELWRPSSQAVPVISFTEAGGGGGVEEGRPPDLLVNLPRVGGVGGVGADPLEEDLVAAGVTVAIEPKPSPQFGKPDVLQLDHDMGEEADPDWSLDQDESSACSTQNSTGDSFPAGTCGANMAAGASSCGANMAAADSSSMDIPLSSAATASRSASSADIPFADSSEASGLSEPSGDPLLPVQACAEVEEEEEEVAGEEEEEEEAVAAGRDVSQLFRELDELSAAAAQVRIPEEFVCRWAGELVVALHTLHTQGLICRDLNPNNLLLNDRGHIQLTFFCSWTEVEESYDREAIAKMYCAPEVGGISEETVACDWWSLGAILFELLTGKSLQQCHPAGISRHTFLSIPEFVSEEARSLLQQLLQYNPAERLGAGVAGVEDIKSHPFFARVTWPK
ncbi:ribosomal protein S6 kinase delta-1 isoform X2 [Clupea harengus]|uniref:Ribosomal protein S6 kinase delta-1 isoform X2 n=1 Tax=Clupea harengus TaxID=7950 RepID=A0A6P8GEI8_CLUHA|nr:ribosomal protein S6 kinase delta-1 isoform X2 [Clupea harengus]